MTDFVFMLRNRTISELCKDFPKAFKMPEWNGDKNEMVKKMLAIDAIQWRLTGEYAKFLKQPLTLGMFVPCDEEGNVLEYPIDGMKIGKHSASYDVCKKAEEKVLFEGFHMVNDSLFFNGLFFHDYSTWIDDKIEDLLQSRTLSFFLTESAIKQIGL